MTIVLELLGALILVTAVGVGTYKLVGWGQKVKEIAEHEDDDI